PRLKQTGVQNRGLELGPRRPVDGPARLVGIGTNVGDRQFDETPFALRFLAGWSQQGLEPPTETPATSDGFRHAGTSGSGSAAGGAGGRGGAARSARPICSCGRAT